MSIPSALAETPRPRLLVWLANPFKYVAGGHALAAGTAIILVTGLLGAVTHSHVDGVLDLHTGAPAPLWFFLVQGFVDWLAMSTILLLAGLVLAKSRFRIIDLFGTQALARAPMLLALLFTLAPGYRRFTQEIVRSQGQALGAGAGLTPDSVVFGLVALVVLVMIIWMAVLMYRAYAVSCNIRGARGITSFIASLLIAEIISKVAITLIARNVMG